MLESEPSNEELASFGLTREDVAAQYTCEVWPDVWPSAWLFADLMTQWRMGPGGPIGLDYSAIPVVMDLRELPAADRRHLFSDIRVMESVALARFARRNKT